MKNMKVILLGVFYTAGFLLAACALLSLLENVENRYIKMLNFPRLQFLLVTVLSLVAVLIFMKNWKWYDYMLAFSLFCGLIINGFFIINYTPLVAVEVPTATQLKNSENKMSILLANVKMTNRNSQLFIHLIHEKKPDFVLAMETDWWWDQELKILERDYPYSQRAINNETYGMILYSKLPLKKSEIRYLSQDHVPSFKNIFTLANGTDVSFYTVHPVPPTLFKNLPDNAGEKENELKKLGKELTPVKNPIIFAGDLNDVVWSHVDQLTGTKNILFDVRTGRGFYNSFSAENIFIAWPLDHIFVSKEFKVKTLQRLPKIGSDHFPVYVELVL